jgi:hypothetical protein
VEAHAQAFGEQGSDSALAGTWSTDQDNGPFDGLRTLIVRLRTLIVRLRTLIVRLWTLILRLRANF